MPSSSNRFASSKSCKQHDLEHRISKQPVLKLKFQNRVSMLSHKSRRARSICRTARRVYLRFKGESLTALALFYAFCPTAKRIYNLLLRNKPLFLRAHCAGIVFIRLHLSCRNFYAVCTKFAAVKESRIKVAINIIALERNSRNLFAAGKAAFHIGNVAWNHQSLCKTLAVVKAVCHIGNVAWNHRSLCKTLAVVKAVCHIGNAAWNHGRLDKACAAGKAVCHIGNVAWNHRSLRKAFAGYKAFFHIGNVAWNHRSLCKAFAAFKAALHIGNTAWNLRSLSKAFAAGKAASHISKS